MLLISKHQFFQSMVLACNFRILHCKKHGQSKLLWELRRTYQMKSMLTPQRINLTFSKAIDLGVYIKIIYV